MKGATGTETQPRTPNEAAEPIAVVGIGCRLPGGVTTPEAFWKLLLDGRTTVTEIPASRWDADAYYTPEPGAAGMMYTRWASFLENVDHFDASFFRISPREAGAMDPQQRLLLEVSWEAIEQAGVAPDQLAGSQTGVFIGICLNEWMLMRQLAIGNIENDMYAGSGTSNSLAAGRLSYMLGLHGPAFAVDTACSSSLVAMHLARQSLLSGECHTAIVGGVNLLLSPNGLIARSQARMMSADGCCHTFDVGANGYVMGEGCVVMVVKRLSDAQADGDRVLALIRGTAINQDGRSEGIMAPNPEAQKAVIRQALATAGKTASDIQYVEAHGTGTPLGDPTELRALSEVFDTPSRHAPLYIGSSKTNVGHSEAAAGLVGLFKTILALQHETIPPHLHIKQLNPAIDWKTSPLTVPTSSTPWTRNGVTRVAGVSSFGFSGTNAHAIVEEAPVEFSTPAPASTAVRSKHVFPMAAKTKAGLEALAARYLSVLENTKADEIAALASMMALSRTHFEHRLALVAETPEEAQQKLSAWQQDGAAAGVYRGQSSQETAPQVVFLFTGQGAQYAGMGRDLYESEPVFRAALDRCADIARPLLNRPLLDVMFGASEADRERIHQTCYTQPALFAIEYAMAALWQSWGVTPAAAIGHSIGEYVAACVADVFSLEDGLRLVVERGRLMQALPGEGGAMAVVMTTEARVRAALEPYGEAVSMAGVNGPENVVIAGDEQAVDELCARLESEGVVVKRLRVSHAFHSAKMNPMLDAFEAVAASVRYAPPRIPVISNVTGQPASHKELTHAAYWRHHVRETVQFQQGMEALWEAGFRTFLEVGPHPVLLGMGRLCVPGGDAAWLPSMRREEAERSALLASLAQLYVRGEAINWRGVHGARTWSTAALPTYPFQRKRYWFETEGFDTNKLLSGALHSAYKVESDAPLLGGRIDSPLFKGTLFEGAFSIKHPAYLSDHRIHGTALFPGTAYVEIGLAAAQAALGEGHYVVEHLNIKRAMVVPEEGTVKVQVALEPQDRGTYAFQVFSRADGDAEAEWIQHASGFVTATEAAAKGLGKLDGHPHDVLIEPLVQEGFPIMEEAAYYLEALKVGTDAGPKFRALRQVTARPGESAAYIRLPEEITADAGRYMLHPVLLDGSLNTMCAGIPRLDTTTGTYVPTSIAQCMVYQPGCEEVWCRATTMIDPAGANDTVTGNIYLYDVYGQPVAEITGVEVRLVGPEMLRQLSKGNRRNDFYTTTWQRLDEETKSSLPLTPGRWLIFSDKAGLGEALAQHLRTEGATPVLVHQGPSLCQQDATNWEMDPRHPEDVQQLIQEAGTTVDAWQSILYLWSAEIDPDAASDHLLEDQQKALGALLHAAQAFALREGSPPPLWIITRGAQRVSSEDAAPLATRASVWGLARVMATELPMLHPVRVDLDREQHAGEAEALLALLRSPVDADEVALRGTEHFVPRLVRYDVHRAWPWSEKKPFTLHIARRGDLDSLMPVAAVRHPPGPGEVEIRVIASGLNFRDVLNALGMYPGEAGPLGGECAGRIVRIGPGVEHVAVGDEVLAFAAGTFSTFVTVPARFVVRKPKALSFEQAAALPIAHITAYYGLHRIAGLQEGDHVLIHSAAGGVGLAAVDIAMRAGAVVFATAGSPEKRAYLQQMGVPHVMDSRTLDFADEILEITEGRGVDIVLNALTGDYVSKGLALLVPGGHFLEIGKRDIRTRAEVDALNAAVAYTPYDLAQVALENPLQIGEMLHLLADAFDDDTLAPPRTTPFPISDVAAAFKYMARAKHIGKVVAVHEDEEVIQAPIVHAEATYLITGGLGGLGLCTAQRLATRGARHLVLVGRSAPSPEAQAVLDALANTGVAVQALRADVSQQAEVEALIAQIQASMPPLRGVIHTAGVLDDGILIQQNWSRFERVMAPKAAGGQYLHEATRALPLDFFVLYSSIASVLGSPGQGNYAAANAFLDGLAAARRAEGLPGLSINWGPWSHVGMAARLSDGDQRRMAASGLSFIAPEYGLDVLEDLIREQRRLAAPTSVAVLPVVWSRFAGDKKNSPLLRELIGNGNGPRAQATTNIPGNDLRQRLQAAAPDERLPMLIDDLRHRFSRTTGVPVEEVQPGRPLIHMGLDSLMAVEFKSQVEGALKATLSVSLLLQGASLETIAADLLSQAFNETPSLAPVQPVDVPVVEPTLYLPVPAEQHTETVSRAEAADLIPQVAQLSDAEVDVLLSRLLSESGDGQ